MSAAEGHRLWSSRRCGWVLGIGLVVFGVGTAWVGQAIRLRPVLRLSPDASGVVTLPPDLDAAADFAILQAGRERRPVVLVARDGALVLDEALSGQDALIAILPPVGLWTLLAERVLR